LQQVNAWLRLIAVQQMEDILIVLLLPLLLGWRMNRP
jgi:hypothetical protein